MGCCDFKNNKMSKDRILKEEHILEYQVASSEIDCSFEEETLGIIYYVQAAFNQFDHKNTGLVATKDLGNVLR